MAASIDEEDAAVADRPRRVRPWMRWADRYLGIPLVAVSRRWRRRSPPAQAVDVGLLKLGCIGDTVLAAAGIADLRARLPDSRITFFAGPDNADTARLIPGVDAVVTLPVRRPTAALAQLRKHRPALLIDLEPWPRISALLTRFAGARYTVGFRTPGQHRHLAYDHHVEHRRDRHEADNHRALLGEAARLVCGASDTTAAGDPHVERSGDVGRGSDAVADGHGTWPRLITPGLETLPLAARFERPVIVFHAWSGGWAGHHKQWPAAHWAELAHRVARDGYTIVFTGGPGDREANERLIAAIRRSRADGDPPGADDGELPLVNLAGQLDIAATVAVLARAAAVVSVNTGVVHLAAAVGAAVVCLDGPTPPGRWGPLGPRCVSVQPDVPGCGYLHLGFEYAGQRTDCMRHIPPAKVHRVLCQLLHASMAEASAVAGASSAR